MSRNRLELYVHLVWTTWDRTSVIDEATEQWLWPAIAARDEPDSLRWQHSYGAFTVAKAARPDIKAYVRNQRLAHNAVDPSARPELEQ